MRSLLFIIINYIEFGFRMSSIHLGIWIVLALLINMKYYIYNDIDYKLFEKFLDTSRMVLERLAWIYLKQTHDEWSTFHTTYPVVGRSCK